jgi:hypothetical protein
MVEKREKVVRMGLSRLATEKYYWIAGRGCMPGRNGRSREIWDASARLARVSRFMAGECFLLAGRHTNNGGRDTMM